MVSKKTKDDIRRYAGWMRRTGRMYRPCDSGGRPIPESAINHMRMDPYPKMHGMEDDLELLDNGNDHEEPDDSTNQEEPDNADG